MIIIHFEHFGEGLTSIDGEPLKEFTICGQDQYFIPAVGKIVGNTVVVSNSKVNAPAAVRYGWKNVPMVNLFGKNGLPVGPFRTDNFLLSTQE